MHLKVWLLCIVYTNQTIDWKKTRFHLQNCPCGTVGAKIGYVLGLLVHGKVVVEFARKVFLVDCPLWKTLNMAKIRITDRAQAFMHTKTPCVTIQRNITPMRYRNDVIRSVLLFHIRAHLGMMLPHDYASCHATTSTLVMRVANNVLTLRWPAKSLDLNSNDHSLDLLKRKVRAHLLPVNIKERVIHQMRAVIPQ